MGKKILNIRNASTSMNRRDALRGIVTLTGTTIALPAMGALTACAPAIKNTFSAQTALLETVSELIIPQTDTPGALAAGVPDYIKNVVGNHFTPEEREGFTSRLSVFDDMAHAKSAPSFVEADTATQTAILTTLDTGNDKLKGREIWQQLKQMTVFGYYTSEAATQELQYNPVPGYYDGNADIKDVGRAWLITGI